LKGHLKSLSQQMLAHVKKSQESVQTAHRENQELKRQLSQAHADVLAMKSVLQVAQQQITNDQAHISQQVLEME